MKIIPSLNFLRFLQGRFRILTSLFLLFALLPGCEKDHGSSANGNVAESFNLLNDAHQQFISLENESGKDPKKALMLLLDWALSQPTVESATVLDSTYLRMTLKSGSDASFWINIVDESGLSINRGSGSAGALAAFTSSKRCANEMDNKKVLIFSPREQEFYTPKEVLEVTNMINSASGFELNYLGKGMAMYDSLKTFGNYGLVIINTHGQPDSFLLSPIDLEMANNGAGVTFPMTEEKLKNALAELTGPETYQRLIDGRLKNFAVINIINNPTAMTWNDIRLNFDLWITGKGMQEMPQWNQTIIFGNFCYSGANTVPDPLNSQHFKPPYNRRAFLDRNPVSYYAYAEESGISHKVSNSFAKQMERHLVKKLVALGDSTGSAHLDASRKEFIEPVYGDGLVSFKLFYRDNYCFKGCDQGEGSFTDIRDNKVYKTVCINNKEWMAENLSTSKFRNGDDIYHAKTPWEWDAASQSKRAARCYYNYDSINGSVYGKLYNWYAVNDPRGLAPENWHVPTQQELIDLTDYYGENAGAKLKSNVGWLEGGNGTNESKFSALPGGFLGNSAVAFGGMGYYGFWWSSTEIPQPCPTCHHRAWYLRLYYRNTKAYVYDGPQILGLSVRCVRN